MIIDSHCHLNHLRYTDDIPDLDSAIAKSTEAGVSKLLSICTTLEEQPNLIKVSEKYKHIYYSVGVHPSEWDGDAPSVDKLVSFSQHDKCKAIGETGLDYHYNDESNWEEQKRRFLIHLEAANQVKKPVIVHTRNAKQDTLDLLKQGNVLGCGGVLHCFTEDYEFAEKVLDMEMYISFSGILTFKNAHSIQDVAKKIPLDKILIETDSPYLSPVPLRGKPNFPHHVIHVAEYLAKLRGVDIELVTDQTARNAIELFDLG